MSERPRPGSGPGRALRVPASLLVALVAFAGCSAPARPSIVLITIDTLRADHLGCYGYERPTSPRIDALAREGMLVERAATTLPRTTPSIASILTGRLPKSHGTRGLLDRLSETNTTLAEILTRDGYDSAAIVSGAFLRPGVGFEQGFDRYDNPEARFDGDSSESVTAAAVAWLDGRSSDRPFFLWVHYLDPLWRYAPGDRWSEPFLAGPAQPPGFLDDLAAHRTTKGALVFGPPPPAPDMALAIALYDGEIARTDAAVGVLLDRLAKSGAPLITLLSADHGESLGEHGYRFAHGEYLYEQGLRVPLVIRYPGVVPAGSRAPGPALNIDVAPTLLALAGVAGMQGVEGRPLLTVQGSGGARRATAAPGRTLVWAESDFQMTYPENPRRFIEGPAGRWTAAGDGRHKLILIPRPGGEILEMYDLASDPGETLNLADDPALSAVRSRLYRAIKEFADFEPRPGDTPSIDPERLRRLRSLGYFN